MAMVIATGMVMVMGIELRKRKRTSSAKRYASLFEGNYRRFV